MDQESIVYGCIKDTSDMTADIVRRNCNRDAMLSLPKAGEWPFLCQEMFSLPAPEVLPGSFQTDVIHFGAAYKAVEYEWDQWVAQFEALLSRMYWVSATVHLETELSGTHTFTWYPTSDCHVPGKSNIEVRCQWSHDGSLSV